MPHDEAMADDEKLHKLIAVSHEVDKAMKMVHDGAGQSGALKWSIVVHNENEYSQNILKMITSPTGRDSLSV